MKLLPALAAVAALSGACSSSPDTASPVSTSATASASASESSASSSPTFSFAPGEGSKEDQVNAAFKQAGIPSTGDHPATLAFAVCLQRKAATHDQVVESLHDVELYMFTQDQVEAVVSISEQIWCPDTPLK
jgi:hypothetical protein